MVEKGYFIRASIPFKEYSWDEAFSVVLDHAFIISTTCRPLLPHPFHQVN